jgi:adenine-specific DNA-methyltransferase
MLERPRDQVEGLARSIGNARVDLNPHQVDAALFALRSPLSRGVLLADEVGLGKSIESALVIAQKWAERRRKILLVVPATLRKQWHAELDEKFFLRGLILEGRTFNEMRKKDVANPFDQEDRILIVSYQFVFRHRALVKEVPWDLVVCDEAHRLRNVWKETRTHVGVVEAISGARQKILVTATPLQNTLKELYGLVSILDENVFGSLESFDEQFVGTDDIDERNQALKERLQHICKRTLRRQVMHIIPFTERWTITADFTPNAAEQALYDHVTEYLSRDVLAALPNARRPLITLMLRKLLASSPAAIGATLEKFAIRLRAQPTLPGIDEVTQTVAEDVDVLPEVAEDWDDDEGDTPAAPTPEFTHAEVNDLESYVREARAIIKDRKAEALIAALMGSDENKSIFDLAAERGAARKAVIFTESLRTQEYLRDLLAKAGFDDDTILINGSNNDTKSKRIYADWKKRNKERWGEVSSGSKTSDMKAAIVEEFRDRGSILLATESAAEGVNLQFCSVVVNYDLPWNPQRIEQRIGRCHRYGQKSDVLVVNLLNRSNEADLRVFQILSEKFRLFEGVFGVSDEVGVNDVETALDFEHRVAEILQSCRKPDEIKAAFDALQAEYATDIKAEKQSAKASFLENFDEEVHQTLRIHDEAAKAALSDQQTKLLAFARYALGGKADFDTDEPRFRLHAPFGDDASFDLRWPQAEKEGAAFFRVGHPLAEKLLLDAQQGESAARQVTFTFKARASALERFNGTSGWLTVQVVAATALERREEFLLVAATDGDGNAVDGDVARKFFLLDGVEGASVSVPDVPALVASLEAQKQVVLEQAEGRHEKFFDEEAEKLDRRQEDLEAGLRRDLKSLDAHIKEAKKDARKVKGLQEKLDAQRKQRDLEKKRDEKQRAVYVEEDRIRAETDAMIEKLQQQLSQKTVETRTLFTLRWTLV